MNGNLAAATFAAEYLVLRVAYTCAGGAEGDNGEDEWNGQGEGH